jgi:large subunit ribosomal protein L9
MRLILRKEVDHLGTRGDIVNVARGYARNFLLPQRLAMEVTDDNLLLIGKEKKIYEAKLAEEKIEAETVAGSFASVKLTFTRKVHGEGEELYGSVSPTDVAEALEKQGLTVEKRKIALSEPVKSLGEYTVSIKLHPEVTATFPITVEKDEEAAKADAAAREAISEREATSEKEEPGEPEKDET